MKKESELRRISKKQNPHCCKHVYRDYSGYLTCSKNEDYIRKKCVDGIGDCDKRVFRYSKKVREISEVKL
jgi:hypothetical protein